MNYTRGDEKVMGGVRKLKLVQTRKSIGSTKAWSSIWQTKKVWELEMKTKFVYCISVLNGNWNNESLCFPSPLPAFFGILRKGKLWAEQTFREFPSRRPPLPWRLFPSLVSLSHWMIQPSPDGRPLHPSHRTRPHLNVCDHTACRFLMPLSVLVPHGRLLALSPSFSPCSFPAESSVSLPPLCHSLETSWVTQHSRWRRGIWLDPDKATVAHLQPQSIWPHWPAALLLETTKPVFSHFALSHFSTFLFVFAKSRTCLQLSVGPARNSLSEITFSLWPQIKSLIE